VRCGRQCRQFLPVQDARGDHRGQLRWSLSPRLPRRALL